MKVYKLFSESRKGGSDCQVFQTWEEAFVEFQDPIEERMDKEYEEDYGCQYDLGKYYTTESSYEIIEQEI